MRSLSRWRARGQPESEGGGLWLTRGLELGAVMSARGCPGVSGALPVPRELSLRPLRHTWATEPSGGHRDLPKPGALGPGVWAERVARLRRGSTVSSRAGSTLVNSQKRDRTSGLKCLQPEGVGLQAKLGPGRALLCCSLSNSGRAPAPAAITWRRRQRRESVKTLLPTSARLRPDSTGR